MDCRSVRVMLLSVTPCNPLLDLSMQVLSNKQAPFTKLEEKESVINNWHSGELIQPLCGHMLVTLETVVATNLEL